MLNRVLNHLWPVGAGVQAIVKALENTPDFFQLVRRMPANDPAELDLFRVRAYKGELRDYMLVVEDLSQNKVRASTLSHPDGIKLNWREHDALYDAFDSWKLNWLAKNYAREVEDLEGAL